MAFVLPSSLCDSRPPRENRCNVRGVASVCFLIASMSSAAWAHNVDSPTPSQDTAPSIRSGQTLTSLRLAPPSLLPRSHSSNDLAQRSTYRLTSTSLTLRPVDDSLASLAGPYLRPHRASDAVRLVLDSFFALGRDIADMGLILVQPRSSEKGMQAKLGPTWMRGAPAARLEVNF